MVIGFAKYVKANHYYRWLIKARILSFGRVSTSLIDQRFAISTLIPINEDLLENFQYAKTVSLIPSRLTNLHRKSLEPSPISFVFHS